MDILDSRIDWKRCAVQVKDGLFKVERFVSYGGSGDNIHKIYFNDPRHVSVDESGVGHKDYSKYRDEVARILFTLKGEEFKNPPDLKIEYEENGDKVTILNIEGWESYRNLPNSYNYSDCHMDTYGGSIYIYDTYVDDITSYAKSAYHFGSGDTMSKNEFRAAMELARQAKSMFYRIKKVING
jgi:hypothetical protein